MTEKISTPNFDAIQPHLCLNAKLRRLHRLLNSAYMHKMAAFGLKGSMLSILFIVGKGKEVTQKLLCEMLVLDESTMSRDIGKLVAKGWVRRRRSNSDARKYALELTNDGYLLLEKVSPIWLELHQRVERLLGAHQIDQIGVMIHAVQTHVETLKA